MNGEMKRIQTESKAAAEDSSSSDVTSEEEEDATGEFSTAVDSMKQD